MAEQRFEGDDPKDTVIGRGQWAETRLPLQSHGDVTQLKPGKDRDGGAELPREPVAEAAVPELPAAEEQRFEGDDPKDTVIGRGQWAPTHMPPQSHGEATQLKPGAPSPPDTDSGAELPHEPTGEAAAEEMPGPPDTASLDAIVEDSVNEAAWTDLTVPSYSETGDIVGEEEELPAGEDGHGEEDTSESPELPAGEEPEELSADVRGEDARAMMTGARAEKEKKSDKTEYQSLLSDMIFGIASGIEQLLKVSQHQGLGAIPTNFGKAFEGIPWSEKPWPDVATLDDYAAGSPAVDLTSSTGTRGAGGWGYGSRGRGNTLTDRAEPARRMPLGG